MKHKQFIQLLVEAQPRFSKHWLETYGTFFHEEHLYRFAYNCLAFYKHGVPQNRQKPLFSEEITPTLDMPFSSFKDLIMELYATDFAITASANERVSSVLQEVPFAHLLLVMGQRQTPATLTTAEGLPMCQQDMLESAFKQYNQHISVGVRAWEKHTERSHDKFWGIVKGSPEEKRSYVKNKMSHIIAHHTWWNTFYHYKHEIVFEIRVESGHGMRWSKANKEFIGFLEPFLT